LHAALNLTLASALLVSAASTVTLPAQTASAQESAAAHGSADATAQALAFEVASIKPSGPDERVVGDFRAYPGGGIIARGCSLQFLIMLAFDLQSDRIDGGPDWIHTNRYNIDAKPPESSLSSKSNPAWSKSPPNAEQRQMLQSLLVERFNLHFHRTSKEGSVFILMKGDRALKLQPPKNKDEYPWAGSIEGGLPSGSGLRGTNISMAQLATRLSGWLHRPVLDHSDLQGSFDFEYKTGNSEEDADVPSAILTSLNGIGLHLFAGKGPVETLIIEHIEKPSAN
jgi:uncharacterized protein (TIGR03435 family)